MDSAGAILSNDNDIRLKNARLWLQESGAELQSDFHNIAGDASFRRYFRVQVNGQSRVLMDAPPPGEDIAPFVDVDRRLRSAGLYAPEIYYSDPVNGYLLLEDLGDDLYRDLLNKDNADVLFPALFDVLKTLALGTDTNGLPDFDYRKLRRDMDLFPEWYLLKHRKVVQHERLVKTWDDFCTHIIDAAMEQPQCFVHRDFHSCNLLKTANDKIGIIDFQDAVTGPVSYDFISLIWDRYIAWPRSRIEKWMEDIRLILELDMEPGQWRRYCDLMGLQRNFKIVGIFARLYYRDQKSGYIEMIPRFFDYLTGTLRLYPEFEEILRIMENPECVP
jgi:aminoglycoside/choline kinase family phosphotransferase